MSKPTSVKPLAAALMLLVLMAMLAGGAVRWESITIDEIAHTGAGVSYLQKLDMRMNEEHPPLAKVIAALPLVLRGVHADYSHISWTFSGQRVFNQLLGEWVFGDYLLLRWNDPISTIMWARVPMLLVTLLLGFVLYWYGSQLGGTPWAGLLCLAVFVSMPPFLAFGPLVITDVVITFFWVLAVWTLPQMWHSPARSRVIKFGLILAGAFLSKFSAGLLFFVFIAVAISMRLRPLAGQPSDRSELRVWRRRAWRNIIKANLWAALFVYLVYFILSWNQSTDSFSVIPHFPASAILRRLLMPPWIYLRGLLEFVLSAGSRPTFILGHAYPHGVWFYFPVLVLLKTPLAVLLLFLLAIFAAVLFKVEKLREAPAIPAGMELHWRCAWVSLVIFTAACILNRLNISIRHFLVPLALMILLLAPLPRLLLLLRRQHARIARLARGTTIVLSAATVLTAIAAYPFYLPFINVLGLKRPGYLLVNDSNLDWNQGLRIAEHFVLRRGLTHVLVDDYGFSELQTYIPQATRWNCQQPSASDGGQWAIVSANLIADASNCQWLFHYLHFEIAGGSMYLFELPHVIPQAGQPGGPPLPKDYKYFGGTNFHGRDMKGIFAACVDDPQKLQPTMDEFTAAMKEYQRKRNK
ncbi:MAG TPA: glycosyltransferase family 39 protein [Terriglobales bacterium]|nr:glycosyltransferase family 39 protein [Terriglobales bacterium]